MMLACGPTVEESRDGASWLILVVSTFDEASSQGILQLQARGGHAVQLRLEGGSIRDELGEAANPLCIGIRDDAVRRLPFSLEGASGTLTAVLLGAGDGPPPDGGDACAGADPVPIQSACCVLPHDCGCDGETEGGEASAADNPASSTGSEAGSGMGTGMTSGATDAEGATSTTGDGSSEGTNTSTGAMTGGMQ